jgi:molybdopterin converting factor small subunit
MVFHEKGFYPMSTDIPIHIQIKLFATLSKFTPVAAERFPVAPGTMVQTLLDRLGVPKDQARLMFVNGVLVEPTQALHDGDRVGIFPPVGGG